MKVLLIAKPTTDPATRYRMLPLQRELEAKGHRVRFWHDHGRSIALARQATWADVIVLQRRLVTQPLLWWLRRCARQLIFDFDDAIFARSDGTDSLVRSRRFQQVVNRADQSWCGNRYLMEQAQRSGAANVHWLPTAISPEPYAAPVDKADAPTLVWVGSSSTRKYLEAFRPLFEKIGDRIPKLRLRILADFDFELENLVVENFAWSAAEEVKHIKSAHIGIAPMTDDGWSRGKCGLKVLQYMAASLPVVCSPVGVNRELVNQGVSGYLADGVDGWSEAIGDLLNHPDRAAEFGMAGRRLVEEKYSQSAVVSEQLRLLQLD